MDDDGQNPPEEIAKLIGAAEEGYEVVFGQFEQKQSSLRTGAGQQGDRPRQQAHLRPAARPHRQQLPNSAPRRRRTDLRARGRAHPYISGQALLYSTKRGNVRVRHAPRVEGESNYNLVRITRLVLTIMFSYSSAPLHAMAVAGSIDRLWELRSWSRSTCCTGCSGRSQVEGWTTPRSPPRVSQRRGHPDAGHAGRVHGANTESDERQGALPCRHPPRPPGVTASSSWVRSGAARPRCAELLDRDPRVEFAGPLSA